MAVRVKYDKALKKLRDAQRKVVKEGNDSVEELAKLGKLQAQYLVPKNTGDLKSFIKVIRNQSSNELTATITVEGFKAERIYGPGNYPDFDLVRWMARTKGVFQSNNPFGKAGTKHIKSGDPQFMLNTTKYLNRIKKGIAKGKFNKINIR